MATVGQLCRRLDGIPLASELAAARLRSMTPNDLLERIGQRFTLLTPDSRAALERQTADAGIPWTGPELPSQRPTAMPTGLPMVR